MDIHKAIQILKEYYEHKEGKSLRGPGKHIVSLAFQRLFKHYEDNIKYKQV